jgi:hypothetical protein
MLVAIRGPPFVADGPFDVEILVALPDGEGSGPGEEFMAEDFCDEDVLGGVPIADGQLWNAFQWSLWKAHRYGRLM